MVSLFWGFTKSIMNRVETVVGIKMVRFWKNKTVSKKKNKNMTTSSQPELVLLR